MATYVCFLRGVNVGGKGKVPMAELKALFEDQGCTSVKTLLQSGNVVFRAKGTKASLTRMLQAAIEKVFKYRSEIQLLTPAELRHVVEGNPFTAEAKKDPGHVVVHFLPQTPAKDATDRLIPLVQAGESFSLYTTRAYVFYAHGQGRSKLAAGMDRALGVRGTARNWNTVTKMLALADEL
jgi:uncharacterized protein (DUF1697 family)